MRSEPFAYTGNGAFVGIGLWVWAVEDTHLVEQENLDSRTLPLGNFGTQRGKQRLDIPPGDICAHRPGKEPR